MIRDQETLQILLDSIRSFVNEVLIPREDALIARQLIARSVQRTHQGVFVEIGVARLRDRHAALCVQV